MTTTTETPDTAEVRFTHRCRHCDMLIGRALGIWNDLDGCVVCPDNPASLTAPHQPLLPPCEPVILDMPWHEIPLGDCVLHDGSWVLLEAMWPATDDSQWLGITVRYGGESRHHQVQADRITVVKRYQEG